MTFAVFFAAVASCENQARQVISLPNLMVDMARFRRLVLQDSTPISVCAIPDAFDDAGNLVLPTGAPPARYGSRQACQDAQADRSIDRRRVVIKSIRQTGDTLIVVGETDRGGFRYQDEFRSYFANGVRNRRYTIGPIVEN